MPDRAMTRHLLATLIVPFTALLLCAPALAPAKPVDTDIGQRALERIWKESWSLMEQSPLRGNLPFRDCFEQASRRYDLPLALLFAVARGESNFDPRAVSTKGCLGVMQIKWPDTAKDLGITRKSDLFDPCINIDAGARYLADLVRAYRGNLHRALAAYNYGPGAIGTGRIPDGAHWYASYIHGHLRRVLSSSPGRMGQGVIRRFDSFQEAALFVDYLKGCVPGLRLRIASYPRRAFDVYFTYDSPGECLDVIQRIIRKTGITPEADRYS